MFTHPSRDLVTLSVGIMSSVVLSNPITIVIVEFTIVNWTVVANLLVYRGQRLVPACVCIHLNNMGYVELTNLLWHKTQGHLVCTCMYACTHAHKHTLTYLQLHIRMYACTHNKHTHTYSMWRTFIHFTKNIKCSTQHHNIRKIVAQTKQPNIQAKYTMVKYNGKYNTLLNT